MNISDNDTNELDSYGVWVKHSSDENNDKINEGSAMDNTDDSLDLPDLNDSDFSDMFKDDSQFSSDLNAGFSDDLDSTLSADELANITSGDITIEETVVEANNDIELETDGNDISIPEPEFSEDSDLSDFEIEATNAGELDEKPTQDISFDDEPSAETEILEDSFNTDSLDVSVEEVSIDDFSGTEEISLDSFGMEDNPPTPSPTSESGEEEISLDDFMENGFSDESVAAGNNGFEAGKGPSASSGTEEVSLDDFVDMSDFDMGSSNEPKEEEIVDEKPLDMDISFDDSAETVETEDNVSIDNDFDIDSEEEIEQSPVTETEEISLSDFGNDFTDTVSDNSNISTEDIDLSDFGIDSEAEETPIVQDVEESKNKEVIVDYDLSVGNENTATAPIVNEIKEKKEAPSAVEEGSSEITKEQPSSNAADSLSTSLLQQIVADLSGLKNEINMLKSNLAEIKAGKQPVNTNNFTNTIEETPIVEETPVSEDNPINETVVADSTSSGGFFDMDDSDDTIALTGSELDNIFNSVEITTGNIDEQNEINESSDLPDEIPFEQAETEINEENLDTSISENEEAIKDSIDTELENNDDLSFDFENEKLEEPSFDGEISFDDSEEDDLPEEISIPKSDDILVETDNSDFMDSVKDNTIVEEDISEDIPEVATDEANSNIEEPTIEDSFDIPSDEPVIEESADISADEPIVEETFDLPTDETTVTEDSLNIPSDDIIPEETTVEDSFDISVDEPAVEQTVSEEPVFEESTDISTDEQIVEETFDLPTDENVTEESADISTDESIVEESADIPSVDSIITEEPTVEDSFDIPSDEQTVSEEPVFEESADIPSVDSIIAEEPAVEDSFDISFDESSAEQTVSEETVFEESTEISTDEPNIEESFDLPTDENVTEESVDISTDESIVEETFDLPTDENVNVESADIPSVDSIIADEPAVEDSFEFTSDEPVVEESVSEETIVEESADISNDEPIVEEKTEREFSEVDNLNNELTNSNIDYLTTKDESLEKAETPNTDLKNDIKSVLLYMDQLLENLPEEKIIEFAKSDEFTTYKKLFTELGLS